MGFNAFHSQSYVLLDVQHISTANVKLKSNEFTHETVFYLPYLSTRANYSQSGSKAASVIGSLSLGILLEIVDIRMLEVICFLYLNFLFSGVVLL